MNTLCANWRCLTTTTINLSQISAALLVIWIWSWVTGLLMDKCCLNVMYTSRHLHMPNNFPLPLYFFSFCPYIYCVHLLSLCNNKATHMCDMVDVWGYSWFMVHGTGCILFPQTQPLHKSTGMAVKKKFRNIKKTENNWNSATDFMSKSYP